MASPMFLPDYQDAMIWHFTFAHVFVALQLQAGDNLIGDVTLRLH